MLKYSTYLHLLSHLYFAFNQTLLITCSKYCELIEYQIWIKLRVYNWFYHREGWKTSIIGWLKQWYPWSEKLSLVYLMTVIFNINYRWLHVNYISIPEAANILGQSRQNIWILVKAGKLKAKRVGNYFIINRSVVEQRIRKNNLSNIYKS